VDDAPEIARVVQHLARRTGQEVVCRGDVSAAWDCLHGEVPRPDLLLLDVNLPGVSGLDLFRRLRQEGGSLASLPVALFVSWSVPATIAAGLTEGIDFVLPKDLLAQPDDWKQRIEEVLDLAAHPPEWGLRTEESPSGLDLQCAITALRHPSLRRLGDEVIQALWGRALRRALGGVVPGAAVDVWSPAAMLTQTLATLAVAQPAFPTTLALALGYQAACLLGKKASEPLRTALAGPRSKG
jgi:CheY-like chemotaxis protein